MNNVRFLSRWRSNDGTVWELIARSEAGNWMLRAPGQKDRFVSASELAINYVSA
jgi:hypothetical protein